MFNNSIVTLADVKAYLNRRLDDNSAVDDDIIDCANDFYASVQRFMREAYPQKTRLFTSLLAIDSSGYDMSLITGVGSMDVVVYRDEVKDGNIINEKTVGSGDVGYYVAGSTLHLTGLTEANVIIQYQKKTDRVVIGSVLSDHILQIDQDLEPAFYSYARMTFFDGQYEYDKRNDANSKLKEWLSEYFNPPSRVIAI